MDNKYNEQLCEDLKSIFDKVRIVNPLKNEILNLSDEDTCISEGECYSILKRKSMCENCVSIRAYNENKTFIKLDYNEGSIYSVIAIPINRYGEKYVLEGIIDITDSMLLNKSNSVSVKEVYNKVNNLNNLVITDELTGCYNRRYINERLPVEINEHKEKGKKLAVVIMDIDNFKTINDMYGHQVGDQVLKETGSLIRRNIRKDCDWVSRYGGEEFLIVFKNMDNENLVHNTERIRKSIEKHVFKNNDSYFSLTASFGIIEMSDEFNEMDKIISEADKKLYKAKKLGKNMIIK